MVGGTDSVGERGMTLVRTAYEAQGEIKKAIKIYEAILQEDIDFGNLKKKVKLLKSTSLPSLRGKPLLALSGEANKNEIVALWGREEKVQGNNQGLEEFSISFGQEHNLAGFDYFMKARVIFNNKDIEIGGE